MSNYKLLTFGNTKTVKGEARGFITAILHLAPSDISGFNVCAMARKATLRDSVQNSTLSACTNGCLNTAGHGGIASGGMVTLESIMTQTRTNGVQLARIRRTRFLFERRAEFFAQLFAELRLAAKRAAKCGKGLAIRLNGTSDLDFTALARAAGFDLPQFVAELRAICPAYRYDYTKVPSRLRQHGEEYDLTYSSHDGAGSDDIAREFLANGGTVAVVFRSKELPASYLGFPVINGDETDLRFMDDSGVIVGLYAKGNAKKDASGFVRD